MKQAQRSLLSLAALIVVAGAIGGVAWWANKDETQKAEQKEKADKLFAFDRSKVRAVRLEKDGKLVAEAAFAPDHKLWELKKPVEADADQVAVNGIVDKLAELKQKQDLGASTEPKPVGLDAPKLKVTLVLDDKSEQGLEVGIDNSFDSSLYVRKLGDKTIRVVDGFHKSALDRSAFDLREKLVAHLEGAPEVSSFSVTNEEPYTLARDGAGWSLTGPGHEKPEPADSSTADRVLAALKALRATAIAAETADAAALQKYGLKRPEPVVEINLGKGPSAFTRVVAIGQANAKTYARRDGSPAVYEVPAQIVKDLQKSWFELQDKTVAKFEREQVSALEIEAPGAAKITVSRKKEAKDGGPPGSGDEQFAVEAPASGAGKRWKISSALYTLAGLKAAAFVKGAPKGNLTKFGLDKPRVYSVLGEGGKLLARIKTGGPVRGNDKRVYALAEGGEHLVEVEAATLNDLPKTLDDVLDVPPGTTDGGTPPVEASVPKR